MSHLKSEPSTSYVQVCAITDIPVCWYEQKHSSCTKTTITRISVKSCWHTCSSKITNFLHPVYTLIGWLIDWFIHSLIHPPNQPTKQSIMSYRYLRVFYKPSPHACLQVTVIKIRQRICFKIEQSKCSSTSAKSYYLQKTFDCSYWSQENTGCKYCLYMWGENTCCVVKWND